MRKLVFWAIAMTASVYAAAAPVMISVDLPTMESKKAWHQLNIPTYELIGNTAIAVAEDGQITVLKQKGYEISIIDQTPELRQYKIVSQKDWAKDVSGKVVYESGKSAIVRTDGNGRATLRDGHHSIRPMNTRPLGDRFWESVTTKYVSLKNIPYDPFIQSLVDQVNADSIASYIQRLQDFKTRVALTDSSYAASAWIKQKFEEWGYTAEFDSFYMESSYDGDCGYERNVIGSSAGVFCPDKEYIVCGHFDTYPTDGGDSIAPGADDNASGTAGTMEVARIFKNYSWNSNIRFMGCAAEEDGGDGGLNYAQEADSMGRDIGGVVNMDMIGYAYDSLYVVNLNRPDSFCYWLSDIYAEGVKNYVQDMRVIPVNGSASDEISFVITGYSGIGVIESLFVATPYYHKATDLLSTLNPDFFSRVTKASVAIMGMLGTYPNPVQGVSIGDSGISESMVVHWDENLETNVTGYWIYYGMQSEGYSDSVYVSGRNTTADTVSGLSLDCTYYFIVRAEDSNGHKSLVATEATGNFTSLVLSDIAISPITKGLSLLWQKNTESDLAGYRIYRKTDQSIWDSLNLSLSLDTTYIDSPLSGASKYYYLIRAFDDDGNHGPFSDSVYGRPITLDQGILVIDETYNWTTGSWPRDAQQDSFYEYILSDYKHECYEYGSSAQKPVISDFVPYSSIVWIGDDNINFMAYNCVEYLKSYLECGGKALFVGWRPSGNMRNSTIYPFDFASGDICYEYFRISHTELSGTTDSFKTAVGLKGYPNISIDSLKYPSNTWGNVFRYIEALFPTSTGDTIYVIDMKNDGSPFEGKACAVRDSGKTVFFGFPLYFMDKEQVKVAAQKIMTEFGEPSGVTTERPGDSGQRPVFRLYQNAPNPFNSKTTISYQLPVAGKVTFNIYNITGQLVKTLVNQDQPAGSYMAKWDGRDEKNRKVSAGVYIYHLTAGDKTQSRKMIVLK